MGKKVEIIKPNLQRKDKKKKYNVAAYARVSTASDEQKESFENQRKYYEERILSNPDYNFVGVFADEAISGTTDKRPNFQRMIKLAENGLIDIIYTKSISRFSRNVADLLRYCEKLKNENVNVIFEEDNINLLSAQGSLMLTILGAVAQMEVENTSSHVNWTLQKKMENGEYVGQANPLGYDIVDNKLVINEEEAEIVRYIFKRYLEGAGSQAIARELGNMGIKTKRGNTTWHQSTVLGILKNEKYTGELLQGKTITVNPIGHKRKDNHGEGNMYRVENEHDAIISVDDWNKVQEIINSRCVSYVDGRKKGTTHNSNQNIFTSKLVCAYCGKNYVRRIVHHGTKNQKAIWHCTTYCKEGKANCPNCKSVDEEYLKMSIVGMIKNLIDDDNSMFYLTNDKLNQLLKKADENKDKLESQISQYSRNIDIKRKKQEKILDMYLDEEITKEECNKKRSELQKEIDKIEESMKEIKELLNYKDNQQKNSKQIHTLIREGKAEGFNKELFDLLIDKIVVGGKRSDGVDDPHSLHYELIDYNLNTYMSCDIKDGLRHYYFEDDVENAKKKVNNEMCSLDSDNTCRVRDTAPKEKYLKLLEFRHFERHILFSQSDRKEKKKAISSGVNVQVVVRV